MYKIIPTPKVLVSIASETEYQNVLECWAYETRSTPEWGYDGPGTYEKTGYFSDDYGRGAVATLRKEVQ